MCNVLPVIDKQNCMNRCKEACEICWVERVWPTHSPRPNRPPPARAVRPRPRLTRKEFLQALRCGGACPTSMDFEEICREHGSTPEYPAYRAALEAALKQRPSAQMLSEKLGGLAQDGLVDGEALRFIVTHFGEKLSDEELRELMRLAEPDADGNSSAMCTNRSVMIHCSRSTFQESSSQQLTEKKEATKVDQVGVKFSRKAFKWTFGNHKTDEAWFRQELTYLPPPTE
eukprot:g12334.t1